MLFCDEQKTCIRAYARHDWHEVSQKKINKLAGLTNSGRGSTQTTERQLDERDRTEADGASRLDGDGDQVDVPPELASSDHGEDDDPFCGNEGESSGEEEFAPEGACLVIPRWEVGLSDIQSQDWRKAELA